MSIARIKELAQHATPGPWHRHERADGSAIRGPLSSNGRTSIIANGLGGENADYLAELSPEVVLAMVEVIEAAQMMRVDITSHESLTVVGSPTIGYVTPTKWHSASTFDAALSKLEQMK